MAFDYSVMLDVASLPVLVVGGGRVATRKVQTLWKAGAEITVIAPEISHEITALSTVHCEHRMFSMEDIIHTDPFLVFAATDDPYLNHEIAKFCKEQHILINTITAPQDGNFSVQSKIERTDYAVSISTFGKGPGFSKALREHLEDILDERMDMALRIYLDIRSWLQKTIDDSDQRVRLLRMLDLDDILAFIDVGEIDYDKDLEKVKKWLSCS